MNNAQSLLAMASVLDSGYGNVPYGGFRRGNMKQKGNAGQKEATKLRNRRNNRLARKNRRLNLRRGKIAGK